ncbi:MAG: NAD(P)/FAD-dependent oxidoreductase [Haliea sp.]|uniref:flavin-containing monooxygenase n=1 Tax=Haliea sp. TaxID=1932666 RepID=UPI0032EEB5DC
MSTAPEKHPNLDFDPDALREKYREERDKRLRTEGNDQYQEVEGKFAHFVDDPYVEPGFTREPLTDEVDVIIIGGGFGGQLAAARLREAGVHSLRIIEKGGDFGGTWYWNRYPGAQCDIESYMYLPLLEEVGYVPREKYSFGSEIKAHAERIGKAYDLYSCACFQTEVKEARWDQEAGRWTISTNRGDAMRARFVIISGGPFNRPKLPGIPGIEDFQGHTFHTSRWDYAYTGGDETGNLDKLGDKRVAVIGTGATAIQCIPHLGRAAQQLYVFQRTPSSVDERGNKPTDPEWVRTLESGWQRQRRENFSDVLAGVADVDLVNDGWTDIFRKMPNLLAPGQTDGSLDPEEVARAVELADFEKMNQVRERVDATVEDRETAEALKPWYRQFCKRPTFSDDYLPTFNRPNVQLVDTQGRGVERITPRGVFANGMEYEVDCIIFATGFEFGTAYTRRQGFEIWGRDELALTDYWQEGPRTFHGYASRGFPNLFHVGLLQSGFSPNFTTVADDQTQHYAYIIQQVLERGYERVEPSAQAEQEWVNTIKNLSIDSLEFLEACTPGFFNNEGKPRAGNGPVENQYGPGINAFHRLMGEWREDGDLNGLELS